MFRWRSQNFSVSRLDCTAVYFTVYCSMWVALFGVCVAYMVSSNHAVATVVCLLAGNKCIYMDFCHLLELEVTCISCVDLKVHFSSTNSTSVCLWFHGSQCLVERCIWYNGKHQIMWETVYDVFRILERDWAPSEIHHPCSLMLAQLVWLQNVNLSVFDS